MPLDRLLIETDSPYLAPMPYRGKTNEPSFVPKVAHKVAELKNVTVDEVARSSDLLQSFQDIERETCATGRAGRPYGKQLTNQRYRKDLKVLQHSGAD